MYKILALSAALVLTGCDARSTANAQQEILKAYDRCLHNAARELDDHRSEASLIGAAVAEKCSHDVANAATFLNTSQEIGPATTLVLEDRNENPR